MQPPLCTPPGPSLEEILESYPQLKREDVDHLQQWLRKQPHLPPMLDQELVPFLHRAESSLERAKRALDAFWTLRTHAPEVFGDRDPALPHNRAAITYFHLAVLPKRDPQGNLVVGMGFEPVDLSGFNAERSSNACAAMMEVMCMRYPMEPGYVCVLDAGNMRLQHITNASLRLVSVLLTFIQQAVPMPMRAIHVINVHSVVEKTMVLVKPFLGRELHRLLHFHSGTMEAFYEALPRDILPREYGGTCGSTADYHREAVEGLHLHKEWVLSLAARLVDESKRPGRNGSQPAYGAAGSFKKLEID